jgi:ornithine carbamoyltransferase
VLTQYPGWPVPTTEVVGQRAISVAELLLWVARPHDAVLGRVPGLVVYRYDAPLFFASAEDFRRRTLAAAPVRWFVLNVGANAEVDFTALAQESVEILGAYSGVPVWNGLTDAWHPTQMLADMLTMRDHASKPLDQVSYCYLGDARNNTANSLLVTGALLGMDTRICAPAQLQPSAQVCAIAAGLAAGSGAILTITEDIGTAVAGADFLYTDVWLSMGEPAGEWDKRIDLLLDYQVNAAVLAATGNPAVKFLHCLPALHNTETEIGRQIYTRRGLAELEVTDEVFESPASVVFDQAENRMHTIKAVMVATLGRRL